MLISWFFTGYFKLWHHLKKRNPRIFQLIYNFEFISFQYCFWLNNKTNSSKPQTCQQWCHGKQCLICWSNLNLRQWNGLGSSSIQWIINLMKIFFKCSSKHRLISKFYFNFILFFASAMFINYYYYFFHRLKVAYSKFVFESKMNARSVRSNRTTHSSNRMRNDSEVLITVNTEPMKAGKWNIWKRKKCVEKKNKLNWI